MKTDRDRNPAIHRDILERAMAGDDGALWARIGEQARGQIRMKRLAAWGTGAAVLLLALSVMALIGLNGARAGRDGWLARVFTPVLEAQAYSAPDPVTGFCPIKLTEGTWRQIEDNTEGVLMPYLPMDLPVGYDFKSGDIRQPDRDTIDMTLRYDALGRDFCIRYRYRYGVRPELDTEGAREVIWDGTAVYLWEGTENIAAFMEEDIYTVIYIEGDIGIGEMEDVHRSVQKCYLDEVTRGAIEAGQ